VSSFWGWLLPEKNQNWVTSREVDAKKCNIRFQALLEQSGMARWWGKESEREGEKSQTWENCFHNKWGRKMLLKSFSFFLFSPSLSHWVFLSFCLWFILPVFFIFFYIYFFGISSERCYISYLFNFFAYFLLCVLFLNYLQNREAIRAARWRCAGKARARRLFDELDKLKWLNEEATQFVVFPPFCRVCEWLMSALKSHSLWCEQNTEGGIIIRRKCSRPLDKRT